MTPSDLTRLDAQLHRLQLHHIQSHYQAFAIKAAEQQRSHLDYLAQLVEGEAALRENRCIERRIKNARFPVLKSLDDFQWSWPKKINRPHIQNLFRLAFVATQTNIVLIGNVGVGKTHLAIALGHAACLNGHSVLFTRFRQSSRQRRLNEQYAEQPSDHAVTINRVELGARK